MKQKYLLLGMALLFFLIFFSATSLALIPGDFGSADNGPPDGVVDFEDLMIFALAYGSTSVDTNWNPDCDIYPDGIIDFEDLMIFALHYGECAPPSAPTLSDPGTNLPSPAAYMVSWSAVTTATSYVLQEATSSDFTSGLQGYPVTGTSKSFSHTVTTITTYYYRVAAINSYGQSDWSNVEDIIINCILPSAPILSDPGTTLPSPAIYTVSWSAVSGATSYVIQEATSSDFSGAQEYTLTGTSESFSHTVTTTTTYYYRVAAVNDCGQGDWSNVEDIIINCILPSAPTLSDPGTTLPSSAIYTVSWSAVTGATSYVLQEATSSDFSGAQEYTLSGTSKSFSHTVTTTTTYYYRVAAIDFCGQSGWSNVEDITIVTGPVHNITKDTYYNTIQAALDDADSLGGDTIEVDDGTYNESITFPTGKVVTLQSASGIRDNVIIQGVNNLSTVTINNSSTGTTLRGFTIIHTGGDTGRGIEIIGIGSGNLIIDNCIISGNTTYFGGGIYNNVGTLNITGSTISYNLATEGGGIYNNGGTLNITSTDISGNTATHGGGIYNCYGTLDITLSDISGNTAASGGGIYNYSGTLNITSSTTISGNTATTHGGGIYNHEGTIDITGSIISGNTAHFMGGIYNRNGTLTITSSTISSNISYDYGGGIYNKDGTLTITSSTISSNISDVYGGGIDNDNGSLTITSSTISGNTAASGGGIFNRSGGSIDITGSDISGNNVTGSGGGIRIWGTGTLTITGSTISYNTATHGGGIHDDSSGTLTITGSTISCNDVTLRGGGIYLTGTGISTIGGNDASDTDNFNTFTDNKKDGITSADQHICNFGGDCRSSYPNNYYVPN